MLRAASLLYLTVLVAVPLGAEESPRERLEMLEGDWTIEGKEATFRETCAWFDQRSHIVCNSESRRTSGVKRGVSVLSYSDEKKRFLYYSYGDSGGAAALDVFIEGGTLIATGEREAGPDLIRTQVQMTRRADGSFDFREQESKNGGPWTTTADVNYVRRDASASGGRQ